MPSTPTQRPASALHAWLEAERARKEFVYSPRMVVGLSAEERAQLEELERRAEQARDAYFTQLRQPSS